MEIKDVLKIRNASVDGEGVHASLQLPYSAPPPNPAPASAVRTEATSRDVAGVPERIFRWTITS